MTTWIEKKANINMRYEEEAVNTARQSGRQAMSRCSKPKRWGKNVRKVRVDSKDLFQITVAPLLLHLPTSNFPDLQCV